MKPFRYIDNPERMIKNWDDYCLFGACIIVVTDTLKKINFRKDDIFFDVKYTTNGRVFGAVKNYINTQRLTSVHVFTFTVEHDLPFELTINFPDEYDISGLTAEMRAIDNNDEAI